MAKSKTKKGLSERKLNAKKHKKTLNPFEVHVNKQKFTILGRKLKNDRGLPGVARAKALKKRKETLLQEYKVKDKSNKFLDRRIGERNSAMTNEDKIIARFTAERIKAHKRKAMFNLADDEILTHRGQSLAEIERFDDPRSDDEDDTDVKGGLDANFVREAHFGGGVLKRTDNSRMSVIDQLIADSKKRKMEKQELKEKTVQMTEALDKNWKDLLPCLNMGKAPDVEDNPGRKDHYDILMSELKFDAKAKPSDRLKSVDEIAAEEARKLKELEEERMRRMKGEDGTSAPVNKSKHRSADDLDDGLAIDENVFSLEYDKEGNLIRKENPDEKEDEDLINKKKGEAATTEMEEDSETEEEEEGADDDDEDDDDDDDDDDGPSDLSDLKVREEEHGEGESDEEEVDKIGHTNGDKKNSETPDKDVEIEEKEQIKEGTSKSEEKSDSDLKNGVSEILSTKGKITSSPKKNQNADKIIRETETSDKDIEMKEKEQIKEETGKSEVKSDPDLKDGVSEIFSTEENPSKGNITSSPKKNPNADKIIRETETSDKDKEIEEKEQIKEDTSKSEEKLDPDLNDGVTEVFKSEEKSNSDLKDGVSEFFSTKENPSKGNITSSPKKNPNAEKIIRETENSDKDIEIKEKEQIKEDTSKSEEKSDPDLSDGVTEVFKSEEKSNSQKRKIASSPKANQNAKKIIREIPTPNKYTESKETGEQVDSNRSEPVFPQESCRFVQNNQESKEESAKPSADENSGKGLEEPSIPLPESGLQNSQDLKTEKKEKKKVSFNTILVEVGGKGELKAPAQEGTKLSPEDFHKYLMEKKSLMDAARKELPYTFGVPNCYEELQDVFKDRSPEEQAVIVERMIKCNHPSLRETNKQKLESLYAFLLQHLNDSNSKECWSILDRLAPLLFDLAEFSPSNAAHCLREVLNEKHSDYNTKKNKYPQVETLVFLKLVPLLFPASDKRHPVTTPAMVFMTEMLQNCQVSTRRSIAFGLSIASLVVEFTSLSKRICPEAINFLCGILHLAAPPSSLKVSHPFKQEHKFLFLHGSCRGNPPKKLKMFGSDLAPKSVKIDDDFRMRSLFTGLSLLEMLVNLYKDHEGVSLLLEPVGKHISNLEVEKYPEEVGGVVDKLKKTMEEVFSKQLSYLAYEAKRPKALRLYEPSIQPVYEGRTKKMMSEEKAEHEKLIHKHKREMKGALREIRRDRVFLSKIKIKEQLTNDSERNRKVKQIYSWGAQQQGELNKIKRSKNK